MFGKKTSLRSSMAQVSADGGGIGPPKLKMPSDAGQGMPRSASVGNRQSSSLGNPLTPLPKHPLGPFKGGTPSLFHSSASGSRNHAVGGLNGVKMPKNRFGKNASAS